jgi:hypothetical protein
LCEGEGPTAVRYPAGVSGAGQGKRPFAAQGEPAKSGPTLGGRQAKNKIAKGWPVRQKTHGPQNARPRGLCGSTIGNVFKAAPPAKISLCRSMAGQVA